MIETVEQGGVEATAKLEDQLRELLGDRYDDFLQRLRERLNRPITIAFMGKTGSGKSTTCNRIFGQDLCKVGHVEATTREVQVVEVALGSSSLLLVDLPGVGESAERTAEYKRVYQQVLTAGVVQMGAVGSPLPAPIQRHVDVVVWVIKADDRALEADETFYRDVFLPACPPSRMRRVVFAISQADKIEPYREWDTSAKRPGAAQVLHLAEKQQQLARIFDRDPADIVSYSAFEGYNLDHLLERVVFACPDEQVPLLVELAGRGDAGEGVFTERTRERAKETFWETVRRVAREMAGKVWELIERVAVKVLAEVLRGKVVGK
jgi:predicted GTPase